MVGTYSPSLSSSNEIMVASERVLIFGKKSSNLTLFVEAQKCVQGPMSVSSRLTSQVHILDHYNIGKIQFNCQFSYVYSSSHFTKLSSSCNLMSAVPQLGGGYSYISANARRSLTSIAFSIPPLDCFPTQIFLSLFST